MITHFLRTRGDKEISNLYAMMNESTAEDVIITKNGLGRIDISIKMELADFEKMKEEIRKIVDSYEGLISFTSNYTDDTFISRTTPSDVVLGAAVSVDPDKENAGEDDNDDDDDDEDED